MFWSGIAVSRMPRSRNGETTPRHAEKTISAQTSVSFSRYSWNSRPIRFRFARRTAGSAGRSTFSRGVNELRGPGIAKNGTGEVRGGLGRRAERLCRRRAGGLYAPAARELPLEQLVRLLAVERQVIRPFGSIT